MKKKILATTKDKKDWLDFINNLEAVDDKENNTLENYKINQVKKLDLHGFSLDQANKVIKKFIGESFQNGFKKLLIITGKGLRSKVHKNPYLSQDMNVLKNTVPEYIKNDNELNDKIKKISKANIKDGGEGAFYILLK